MKIRGDIERVNLSTGERFRRVTGDGESRLEREQPQGEATRAQTKGGEKPRSPYWSERDDDGHCTRCGLYVDPETEQGINSHECPPGFWTPLHEPSSPPATAGMARESLILCDPCAAHHPEHCDTPLPCRSYKRLQAEVEKLRQEQDALGNLLAVIHRDGGHYEVEHGTINAAKDAEAVVCREREARGRAEKALREATDAIRWALGSNGDFTERKAGQGPYWWRTELRERSERALASLKSSESSTKV